jgi:hypothetical protein
MARITGFAPSPSQRYSVHEPVECGYKMFIGEDGQRYLQLDTYCSSERAQPGKISQSIQRSKNMAVVLEGLIHWAFPDLPG